MQAAFEIANRMDIGCRLGHGIISHPLASACNARLSVSMDQAKIFAQSRHDIDGFSKNCGEMVKLCKVYKLVSNLYKY